MQIVFGASLPCTTYQGAGYKLFACAACIAVRSDKIDYELAKFYGKIAMSVTPGMPVVCRPIETITRYQHKQRRDDTYLGGGGSIY